MKVVFCEGDAFVVRDASGAEVFTYSYDDLSGDWRAITFAPDDEYIILGLPYELEIFHRRRAA